MQNHRSILDRVFTLSSSLLVAIAFMVVTAPQARSDGHAKLEIDGLKITTKAKAPDGHPLDEVVSGWVYRKAETQELQKDDFQNPGFIWVEQGEELWSKVEGSKGKACESCHNEASKSMKGVGASMPKWNDKLNKPINLEQQINRCRTDNMGAEAWKWESNQLLSMTTYVRHQSRGVPVKVKIDGAMKAWFDKGKDLYFDRVGQLDLACANCHQDYFSKYIRADRLSQGQSNGFPTYRLKWQKVGSLHRRFKGCMKQVRAKPYKVGGDEFLALELYLAWRGSGLSVETPAVRQ